MLDAFLESLVSEQGASPHTVAAYKRDITKFIAHLKPVQPVSAERQHIEAFLRFLHDEGLAAKSQARALSSVKRYYHFLMSEKLLSLDPSERIKAPKTPKNLPKALEEADVIKLLDNAEADESSNGVRLYVLLEVLYATGLRVSELVSLPLDAVTKDEHGEIPPYIIVRGKGQKERLLPLGGKAQQAMVRYLPHREAEWKGKAYSPYLFPSSSKKGHLTRQRFGQLLKQLALKAHIEPHLVSPHVIRHSFATHLLNRGLDLRTLQELLGHSDITTTQIYTHMADDTLIELVNDHHPLAQKGHAYD